MRVLLIVYDNDSHISCFPMGIAYLAAYIEKYSDHKVDIYGQDVAHYSYEHLTSHLNNSEYDVVGLGFVAGYYQYKTAIKIANAVNSSKRRDKFKFVLGGHGPSPEPQYFLDLLSADTVFCGESEKIFLDYLGSGCVGKIINSNKLLDVGSLPWPAWDKFPIEHYVLGTEPGISRSARMLPIMSGRGCPFACNFCYKISPGFRPRHAIDIVDEIIVLKREYAINAIFFWDDLLMSSKERMTDICETIMHVGIEIEWACSGRLNYADKDVLALMKEAGCVFINYGIESLDDSMLKVMNKHLTVEQITRGVENTLSLGIKVGLNVIFGNIGETIDILEKGVKFLKQYGDGSQLRTIRPVTPYPGSPLYYYAVENKLLGGVKDFYTRHVNSDLLTINFTPHTDDEVNAALLCANKTLITDYYLKNENMVIKQAEDLYVNKNINFRGFRGV